MKISTIFIILLIFFGCSLPNDKNKGQFKEESNFDTIYFAKKIPLFKIDSIMHPVLSNIIQEMRECPYYNNKKYIFNFIVKENSEFADIYIEYCNSEYIGLNNIGYFNFRNELFIIKLPVNANILHKTNDSTFVTKYQLLFPQYYSIIDDTGSRWWLRYNKKDVQIISKTVCNY